MKTMYGTSTWVLERGCAPGRARPSQYFFFLLFLRQINLKSRLSHHLNLQLVYSQQLIYSEVFVSSVVVVSSVVGSFWLLLVDFASCLGLDP